MSALHRLVQLLVIEVRDVLRHTDELSGAFDAEINGYGISIAVRCGIIFRDVLTLCGCTSESTAVQVCFHDCMYLTYSIS